MTSRRDKQAQVMHVLAKAYRGQEVCRPPKAWYAKVMEAVHRAAIPARMPPETEQMPLLWCTAGLAAGLALVVAVWGLRTTPSHADLAWQLQQDAPVSAWILPVGKGK